MSYAATAKSSGLIRPHHGRLSFLYRVADAVLVFISLYIASLAFGVVWQDRYSFILLLAVTLFNFLAGRHELYRSWRVSPLNEELLRVWLAWLGTAVGLLVITFILKSTADYSRLVIGSWFVATPLVLGAWRVVVRSALRDLRRRGFNTRTVAIVGANDLGQHLASTMLNASWMGLRVVGFFDDRSADDARLNQQARNQLRGNIDTLLRDVNDGDVDLVYITFPLRAEPRVNELVYRLSDTTVSIYFVPDFNVFDMLHGRWFSVGELPVVSIFESPHSGIDGWVKRLEDVFLSLVILLMISVPMLVIALLVKLTSRGPVIFKQRRYGVDGREFDVWKFRTMCVMEDGANIRQATVNDPRVTRFGAFLRRTSLDELPQFFNVLQGTMSIVGPRPHAVAHNEEYRKLINRYMLRHKVRPGITGLAQINGFRGETDTLEKMEKRVQYDLEYIKTWSLLLDMKLILLTILRGFSGKGAY